MQYKQDTNHRYNKKWLKTDTFIRPKKVVFHQLPAQKLGPVSQFFIYLILRAVLVVEH